VEVKRLCLDTSAYSQFKAGQPQAVEAVSGCRLCLVPSIVLGELRAGFKLGTRHQKNESELKEFLSSPVVQVLDVDDEATHHFSEIIVGLRRKGSPIPTNDIWIAALAMREGATVLTFDAHFDSIDHIAVQLLAS
jgi:tRNA(fMet)-specific endonuclease VapC